MSSSVSSVASDAARCDEVHELNEVRSLTVGPFIGLCKWFSDKLGYGFITVYKGDNPGSDLFVHYTSVSPLNSNHRTLKKGEYVSFDIGTNETGAQAIGVTGVLGGPLMCDHVWAKGSGRRQQAQGSNQQHVQQGSNQQHVQQGNNQQHVQQGGNQQHVQQGSNQQHVQQQGSNQQAQIPPACDVAVDEPSDCDFVRVERRRRYGVGGGNGGGNGGIGCGGNGGSIGGGGNSRGIPTGVIAP
jgi:CspA family cold shock protein